MMDNFDLIRPYNDEEAREALAWVSGRFYVNVMSRYLFPDRPVSTLATVLRNIKGVEDFQDKVMGPAVASVMEKTSDGLSWEGMEHLHRLSASGRKFLLISNHRDIVLDPALIDYVMWKEGVATARLCVGSNLLGVKLVREIMRSNKIITVMRGLSPRETFHASENLSTFIRASITSGESSVWIAQKEGRAKDGNDRTDQAVLKMLAMSGESEFAADFEELSIVPLTFSYEYESCDYLKAREVYLRSLGPYKKKRMEDVRSILTGITQDKGHVHLTIGEPLSAEEIGQTAALKGNARFTALRELLDRRIISGYRLWKTNYMARDIMDGTSRFADKYTPGEMAAFVQYVESSLDKIKKRERPDRDALRNIFLQIYGNPVSAVLKD